MFFKHIYIRAPKTKNKKVYLTFDDGPNPLITKFIQEQLSITNTKATFFLLGIKCETYPNLAKKYSLGNSLIANHGYVHLNGFKANSVKYIENIAEGEKVICKHFSLSNNLLFRPPYGKMNLMALLTYDERKLIGWSLLSKDYLENKNSDELLKRLKSKTRNGSIVVFHENDKAVKHLIYILPKYLLWLKEQEYTTAWVSDFIKK